MSKIVDNSKVAILMATYNGERYIKAQIESILSQTETDWNLYIQDDGSTDSTISIIKSFKDSRIHFVDVGLTRQGPCMNFMNLLNMIDAKAYMFSDQDDVWKDFKIKLQLEVLHRLENSYPNRPVLLYSDKSRVDANLNMIYEKEFNRRNLHEEEIERKLRKRNTLDLILLRATGAGCTMCFNYFAKIVSFPYYNLRYQDSILMISVIKNNGVIEAMTTPTIFYRSHSHNTVGCVGDEKLSKKLSKLNQVITTNRRAWYLWKIYGGGSFLKFIKAKYFLFKTRDI